MASLTINSDRFDDSFIAVNRIYHEDCLKFMDRLKQQNTYVHIVVASLPYNVGKEYSGTSYNDNCSEYEYLAFTFQVVVSHFMFGGSDMADTLIKYKF